MKLTQIILCLTSLLVSLVGLELFAGYQSYQQTKLRPPVYIADPILGFRLKTGFRDHKTYSYQKPPNTTRILMLGDSFTQGDEVPIDKTFSKLLETKLNAQANRAYEVINAGVRGSGSLQQYLWFKNQGLKFNPDLVILNFYLGNDITDALMFNIATDSAGLATKLTLKDTYVDNQGYLRRIRSHFSLCDLSAFCRLYLRPKSKSINWDSTAWQITQRHLLAIKSLAENNRSQFILTLIPEASLVDSPIHQILLDFAQTNNLKLIDFTPGLDRSMYDTFDRHWNQAGHQLAAQVLYEYLLSL